MCHEQLLHHVAFAEPDSDLIVSPSSLQRIVAEFVGTAWLAVGVVGSGIMAERLAAGNDALALLANAVATGGALYTAILVFAPVSGAHFNPLVSFEDAWRARAGSREALFRSVAQIAGAIAGVALANAMFDLPLLFASHKARSGVGQFLAEVVATFGLISMVRLSGSAAAIAAYIVGAYWFTASTSFANPAITIGRAFTDTFTGIRPLDVLPFAVAQAIGCASAALFTRWLKRGVE